MKVGASQGSQECADALQTLRQEVRAVYDERTLIGMETAAERIIDESDLEIKICWKAEEDAICNECLYQEDCARGNFSRVITAYALAGVAIDSNSNPVIADCQDYMNLRISKEVYPARELFNKELE
jgi:hypothetical protein